MEYIIAVLFTMSVWMFLKNDQSAAVLGPLAAMRVEDPNNGQLAELISEISKRSVLEYYVFLFCLFAWPLLLAYHLS